MQVKGYCPVCDSLIGLSPTRAKRNPNKGSDEWWRVDMHAKDGVICEGSGKLV